MRVGVRACVLCYDGGGVARQYFETPDGNTFAVSEGRANVSSAPAPPPPPHTDFDQLLAAARPFIEPEGTTALATGDQPLGVHPADRGMGPRNLASDNACASATASPSDARSGEAGAPGVATEGREQVRGVSYAGNLYTSDFVWTGMVDFWTKTMGFTCSTCGTATAGSFTTYDFPDGDRMQMYYKSPVRALLVPCAIPAPQP